ncbi:MAG: molybdopterin molybdotransferase MoeA [Chloroflexi bacterium]|nr:molybdopterin molybdotransferase MoeA [Chloroflexota bacterium]
MPRFFDHLMDADEALALFLKHATPLSDREIVATEQAIGRVAARDITSPQPLPEFPRSTVDGYAVRQRDAAACGPDCHVLLALVGELPMGQAPAIDIGPGETVLVHTGGMLPRNADAVVMLEDTELEGRAVTIMKEVRHGDNVIKVGEDVRPGQTVIPAGHRLRPQDIGGLLALGIIQIDVVRQPRVMIFSSGDEVIDPADMTRPGQVRDVNSYTVFGLAQQAGAVAERCGILPDDLAVLRSALADAMAARPDMIVLSAGSSVSDRDHTPTVLRELGQPGVLVHGIAIKPGKPTLLGAAGSTLLMGLPGNPMSAMVQFMIYGMPALYKQQGSALPSSKLLRLRLKQAWRSSAERAEYVPCRIEANETGEFEVRPIPYKSNLIFRLVEANGLFHVPQTTTLLEAGTQVDVRLF